MFAWYCENPAAAMSKIYTLMCLFRIWTRSIYLSGGFVMWVCFAFTASPPPHWHPTFPGQIWPGWCEGCCDGGANRPGTQTHRESERPTPVLQEREEEEDRKGGGRRGEAWRWRGGEQERREEIKFRHSGTEGEKGGGVEDNLVIKKEQREIPGSRFRIKILRVNEADITGDSVCPCSAAKCDFFWGGKSYLD